MKLVARLNGEHAVLADKLREEGHKAKLVRGAVVCDLVPEGENKYRIPDGMFEGGDPLVLIDVFESGGATEHNGSSQVVCGLSGKALYPYFVPNDPDGCGMHAHFSVPGAVVLIKATQRGTVFIREFHVETVGYTARLDVKTVWEGRLEDLPQTYGRYKAAAKAAVEKALCRGCKEPHFIAERKG